MIIILYTKVTINFSTTFLHFAGKVPKPGVRGYNTFKYIFTPPNFVVFSLHDLYSLKSFTDKLKDKLEINSDYLVLIKIRFTDNYKMAGSSSGFSYENILSFNNLYDRVLKGLIKIIEQYSYPEENVVYIQLIFRKIDKKLLSDILLDKNSIDNKSKPFFNKIIPSY